MKDHHSSFVFPATRSPSFVIATRSPSFVIATCSPSFVIATRSPSFVIATMRASHPNIFGLQSMPRQPQAVSPPPTSLAPQGSGSVLPRLTWLQHQKCMMSQEQLLTNLFCQKFESNFTSWPVLRISCIKLGCWTKTALTYIYLK